MKENSASKPEGIDFNSVFQEVFKLAPRNDTLYKWRVFRRNLFQTIGFLILTFLGLLLFYYDMYTPARIPFGWLIGLALAIVFGIFFIISVIVTIKIAKKRTYICTHDDIFHVIKPIKSLSNKPKDLKYAIKQLEWLDDLSLQLVIPSNRNKLKDFFQVVQNTLEQNLDTFRNQLHKNLSYKLSFSVEHEFRVTSDSYCDDNIVCGIASVVVKMSLLGSQKEKELTHGSIYVVAVKSNAGNWYLALPELDTPHLWIKLEEPNIPEYAVAKD